MNNLDSAPLFHFHEGREALSIIIDPERVPSFLGRSARRLSALLRPRDRRNSEVNHPGHDPASSLFTRLRAAVRRMAKIPTTPVSGLFVTAESVHQFPMTRHFSQIAARFPLRAHRAFVSAVNRRPAMRIVQLRRNGVVLHELCGGTLTTTGAWPGDRNGIISLRASNDLLALLMGPSSCSFVICGPAQLFALVTHFSFARGAREFVECGWDPDERTLALHVNRSRRALETSQESLGAEIHRSASQSGLLVYEPERIRHLLERQRGDTLFVSNRMRSPSDYERCPVLENADVLASAQAKGVDIFFVQADSLPQGRGFGLVAHAS